LKTDISLYNNSWYNTGGSKLKRLIWFYANAVIFNNSLFPVNALKIFLLKIFGAEIGKGVVIKPSVNIKYPWNVSIGNYSWIGENVWIDSLVKISIGSNVCISQGAYLLTGNHNYKKTTFDLMVQPIILEDGVWIGARSIVCPGIICKMHAVLTAGSVARKNLDSYTIYQGNPAIAIKKRVFDNNLDLERLDSQQANLKDYNN
jgi:putative colanic acid biosynthesis acetyltransferase WcaF